MDPIAHTLVGGALAAAGLRRATPLAIPALVIGANLPDVDIVTQLGGPYASLALRRGVTHGIPALVLLPLILTALLLAWDRGIRSRRAPGRPRARAGPLLALSALAVATHPILDWMNSYGMRWLLPFDGRWSYGDALFIVDPWIWLTLGGVLFLIHGRTAMRTTIWVLAGVAATALMLMAPMVPAGARVAWVLGIVGLGSYRLARGPKPRIRSGRRAQDEALARTGLALVGIYMALMVGGDRLARVHVRAALEAQGRTPVQRVMVSPAPGNPFRGSVVAETPETYYIGEFTWLSEPRMRVDADSILRPTGSAVLDAARTVPEVRDFLVWSRFPFFEVEERATGYRVRVGDARYRGQPGANALAGLTVELDRELRSGTRVR